MSLKERYSNVPADRPLTIKQRLFVEAYFASDYNAAEACRRAGYSGNNHNRIASQLMARANVKAAVEELAKKKIEEVSLTEAYVVKTLVRTIEKAERDNNLTAVLRGIELAAKNLGMLRDRTEITGKDGEAIRYEEVENEAESFKSRITRLSKRTRESDDNVVVLERDAS